MLLNVQDQFAEMCLHANWAVKSRFLLSCPEIKWKFSSGTGDEPHCWPLLLPEAWSQGSKVVVEMRMDSSYFVQRTFKQHTSVLQSWDISKLCSRSPWVFDSNNWFSSVDAFWDMGVTLISWVFSRSSLEARERCAPTFQNEWLKQELLHCITLVSY